MFKSQNEGRMTLVPGKEYSYDFIAIMATQKSMIRNRLAFYEMTASMQKAVVKQMLPYADEVMAASWDEE